jgi:hypothetical protein
MRISLISAWVKFIYHFLTVTNITDGGAIMRNLLILVIIIGFLIFTLAFNIQG